MSRLSDRTRIFNDSTAPECLSDLCFHFIGLDHLRLGSGRSLAGAFGNRCCEDHAGRREHQYGTHRAPYGARSLRRVLQQLLRRADAPAKTGEADRAEPRLRLHCRFERIHRDQRTRRRAGGRLEDFRDHQRRQDLRGALRHFGAGGGSGVHQDREQGSAAIRESRRSFAKSSRADRPRARQSAWATARRLRAGFSRREDAR